ncbi:hypothetical protein M2140_000091 [Clostridiales Family XIII bacterium PM5-7]
MNLTVDDIFDIFDGRPMIECLTENEAKEFIEYVYSIGFHWCDDDDKETYWNYYRENTFYRLCVDGGMIYGNRADRFISLPYEISFQEFMDLTHLKPEFDPDGDEFEKILLSNY